MKRLTLRKRHTPVKIAGKHLVCWITWKHTFRGSMRLQTYLAHCVQRYSPSPLSWKNTSSHTKIPKKRREYHCSSVRNARRPSSPGWIWSSTKLSTKPAQTKLSEEGVNDFFNVSTLYLNKFLCDSFPYSLLGFSNILQQSPHPPRYHDSSKWSHHRTINDKIRTSFLTYVYVS